MHAASQRVCTEGEVNLSCAHQASADSRQELSDLRTQLESQLTEKLGTLLMTGDRVQITAGTQLTLPPETGRGHWHADSATRDR